MPEELGGGVGVGFGLGSVAVLELPPPHPVIKAPHSVRSSTATIRAEDRWGAFELRNHRMMETMHEPCIDSIS